MHTAVGLRFLRTLAQRGERVPAYLLPTDSDPSGAQHLHTPTPPSHRAEEARGHTRAVPR